MQSDAMGFNQPDSSLRVGHLTAMFKAGSTPDRKPLNPKEKPNGMNRARTSAGKANRAAMPMKASNAAVAAEGRPKGLYVDC
jgi:hypothetical protein